MNKMMNSMKNDDYMMEKMTPYDMMKKNYNNKWGDKKDSMDMHKFEKMFEMMSEMKSKNKPYDYMNKKDAEQHNLPSAWFKERYEQIVDTCYEVATNLPNQLDEVVEGDFGTVKLGQIKSFMSCCKNAKQKLCMNQDIKNKIETNFGPVEEILESFKYQITENQLFTHVNQLLQGSEEEYM